MVTLALHFLIPSATHKPFSQVLAECVGGRVARPLLGVGDLVVYLLSTCHLSNDAGLPKKHLELGQGELMSSQRELYNLGTCNPAGTIRDASASTLHS